MLQKCYLTRRLRLQKRVSGLGFLVFFLGKRACLAGETYYLHYSYTDSIKFFSERGSGPQVFFGARGTNSPTQARPHGGKGWGWGAVGKVRTFFDNLNRSVGVGRGWSHTKEHDE